MNLLKNRMELKYYYPTLLKRNNSITIQSIHFLFPIIPIKNLLSTLWHSVNEMCILIGNLLAFFQKFISQYFCFFGILLFFWILRMDPVHENLIEPNKQNELLKTALQIASGSKSLPEHCAKIRFVFYLYHNNSCKIFRELILNRDTEIRRNALNDFAFIVINLPVDLLSNTENSFLLDFFAARFTDSGHSADLLVTVVHYLVSLFNLFILLFCYLGICSKVVQRRRGWYTIPHHFWR